MTKKSASPAPVSGFSQSRTPVKPPPEMLHRINEPLCEALSKMYPGGLVLTLKEINTITGTLINAYNRQMHTHV